jgi:hypothetical protein
MDGARTMRRRWVLSIGESTEEIDWRREEKIITKEG